MNAVYLAAGVAAILALVGVAIIVKIACRK